MGMVDAPPTEIVDLREGGGRVYNAGVHMLARAGLR
jgi:hypothetical protein